MLVLVIKRAAQQPVHNMPGEVKVASAHIDISSALCIVVLDPLITHWDQSMGQFDHSIEQESALFQLAFDQQAPIII